MPKQANYVILTRDQIKTTMITHAKFDRGDVHFLNDDNKIGRCIIVKQPIEGNICQVVEYSRKELDDILIENNKQNSTSGGISIHYHQRDVGQTKTTECLFDMVIIRYGADIQFDYFQCLLAKNQDIPTIDPTPIIDPTDTNPNAESALTTIQRLGAVAGK
jgi:hypothetical protein